MLDVLLLAHSSQSLLNLKKGLSWEDLFYNQFMPGSSSGFESAVRCSLVAGKHCCSLQWATHTHPMGGRTAVEH